MSNYRPSLGQVPSEPKPPSIGELFGRMTAQISTLIRGEIELTKTKAMTFLNFAKAGIIALVLRGFSPSTAWDGFCTVLSLHWLWFFPLGQHHSSCVACFLDRHHLRSDWHLEAEEV